ncbi:hypothetical protein AWC38_SpisGene21345 [Stylophora pistillata]|uniref:Uncharacterized protein n=1 Tax=Stylophora pistillata TaxID=50429 RepID=A0A2B4RA20_STYPI|nr:hypothetical protein AWC38_SpisGene21345 [Stylophora pistillata]
MAHTTRAGRVRPWTVSQDLVGMMYDLRVAANARELESNLESIDEMIVMREPPSPEFPKAQREVVLALKRYLEQLKDTREPTPAMRELEGAPIKALGMLEDLLIVVADHATDNDLWKLDARITNSIFKPSPFDLPEEKKFRSAYNFVLQAFLQYVRHCKNQPPARSYDSPVYSCCSSDESDEEDGDESQDRTRFWSYYGMIRFCPLEFSHVSSTVTIGGIPPTISFFLAFDSIRDWFSFSNVIQNLDTFRNGRHTVF